MKITFHKEVENGRKRVVIYESSSPRVDFPKGRTAQADKQLANLTRKASKVFLESPFGGSIEVDGTPKEVITKINKLIERFE